MKPLLSKSRSAFKIKKCFKTGAEMTWQEIARELGVTEFAVRQTYARAMRKLRRRCRRIGYDLHDIIGRCESNLARAEMWS